MGKVEPSTRRDWVQEMDRELVEQMCDLYVALCEERQRQKLTANVKKLLRQIGPLLAAAKMRLK